MSWLRARQKSLGTCASESFGRGGSGCRGVRSGSTWELRGCFGQVVPLRRLTWWGICPLSLGRWGAVVGFFAKRTEQKKKTINARGKKPGASPWKKSPATSRSGDLAWTRRAWTIAEFVAVEVLTLRNWGRPLASPQRDPSARAKFGDATGGSTGGEGLKFRARITVLLTASSLELSHP